MNSNQRNRGASLIVVIWVTTIIAGLAVAFLRDTTTDQLRLRNLADEIQADAVVEAALARTVLALAESDQSWEAGEPHNWEYDDAKLVIDVVPEIARFDLNRTPLELITILLEELEIDQELADSLLENLADARGIDLESDDDLVLTTLEDAEEEGEEEEEEEEPVEESAGAPPFLSLRELAGFLEEDEHAQRLLWDRFTVYTGASLPENALLEPELKAEIEAADLEQSDGEPQIETVSETDEDETSLDQAIEEEPADDPEEAPAIDLEELLERSHSLAELAAALGEMPIFRIDLLAELRSGFRRRVAVVLTLDETDENKGYRVLDWQPMVVLPEETTP